MKIYLATERAVKQPLHVMRACPANDPVGLDGIEAPNEWFNPPNPGETELQPKEIEVQFVYGEAEVPDNLGRYLVKIGAAKKTRLILPRGYSQ